LKAIDPISSSKNLERIAARVGLTFHLDGSLLVPYAGWRSEVRTATEEEQVMWAKVTAGMDPDDLPATPEEIQSSWKYRPGPFTVSSKDAPTIMRLGQDFIDPTTQASDLYSGLIGWLKEGRCPVYVSRAVPMGFYFMGPRYEPMFPPIPEGVVAWVPPDLTVEEAHHVRRGLQPFMIEP
jgi:hypothetical protein